MRFLLRILVKTPERADRAARPSRTRSRSCPKAMHWLYLIVAIVAEVFGTSFLRAAAGFTRPLPTLCVALGYGLAFYCLSLTVEKLPVGLVYAVWSGAGVTLIAAIGWLFMGQRPDAAAIVGMGLIVMGVVVLNLFSNMQAH